ncbi:hypothetical protein HDU67_007371 [Dinochytrium kinnereticum]|nr:hypothetical protein HDU67_007371 [Dinochytrium kinnereticum]
MAKDRKAKGKKKQVEMITYDEKTRKEYLTGFHKRNVERKKKYEKSKLQQVKAMKTEARKVKRASRKELIKGHVEKIEAVQNFGNLGGGSDQDDSPAEVIESQETMEFQGQAVTVTISSAAKNWDDDEEEEEDALPPAPVLMKSRGRVNMSTGGGWVKKPKVSAKSRPATKAKKGF